MPVPTKNQIKVLYKENRKLKIVLSVPDLNKELVRSDLINLGNFLFIYTNINFGIYFSDHIDLLGVWDIEHGQECLKISKDNIANRMVYRDQNQIKEILTALSRPPKPDPTWLEEAGKKVDEECTIS